MTVAVIAMCKDEADVVTPWADYYQGQVDHVYVADNGSTDGTRAALAALWPTRQFTITDDPEVGYWQAEKMTALAARALADGHKWVIPADLDEIWYATDGRRLADYLGGLAPDVAFVEVPIYNHLPTALDRPESCEACGSTGATLGNYVACASCLESEPNPFRRISWRQREHGALPKVCARLRPGLEIRQGNHSAWAPGSGLTIKGGIVLRHFSWRSLSQYQRKLANGWAAYQATDLPESTGGHWRMFGDPSAGDWADRVREHYERWFHVADPHADSTLIYDPCPGL